MPVAVGVLAGVKNPGELHVFDQQRTGRIRLVGCHGEGPLLPVVGDLDVDHAGDEVTEVQQVVAVGVLAVVQLRVAVDVLAAEGIQEEPDAAGAAGKSGPVTRPGQVALDLAGPGTNPFALGRDIDDRHGDTHHHQQDRDHHQHLDQRERRAGSGEPGSHPSVVSPRCGHRVGLVVVVGNGQWMRISCRSRCCDW